MEPICTPKRFKDSVSDGFKIHCLRTTLAFVKNNVTKDIEFPELSSEQAQFMQLLLEGVITFADCENVGEVNELYRALWEAVKIHSLKYDFRINTVDSCGDKKSLVFEKLPKQKKVESATYTKQRAISTTPPVVSTNQPPVATYQSTGIQLVSTNEPMVNGNEPSINTTQPNVSTKQTNVAMQPSFEIKPVTGNTPMISGIQPGVSTNQPEVKTNQPAIGAVQPVVSTNKPTSSEEQPILSGIPDNSTKPPIASTYLTDALVKQPVLGSKQPTACSNQPVIGEIQPVVVSVNQPVDSGIQPVESGIQPVVSGIQPVVSVIQPVVSGIQPVASANQPVTSENQTTVSAIQLLVKDQPAKSTKEQGSDNKQLKDTNKIKDPPQRVLSKRRLAELRNCAAFINKLPKNLVCNAFNAILEFLADDTRRKTVFVPKNQDELVLYRKCIDWTSSKDSALIFEGQYKPFCDQVNEYLNYMKCHLPKPTKQIVNTETGIREVTYVKRPKCDAKGNPVVKPPNLPTPIKYTEFKIPSIYTSLRNKKKNKKLKNKNLVKVKTPKCKKSVVGVSQNPMSMKCSDTSSEVSSSSRGTSQERKNVQQSKKARKIAKCLPKDSETTLRDMASNCRKTRWLRDEERKEQLIEALSVPVQSDKAMKIMRGMGWSGGALGARGNGITVPIMPALDIPKGYGFGAYKISPQLGIVTKQRATPKTVTIWPTDANLDIEQQKSDIIVEKTKQILLEKPSFDKLMKGIIQPITGLSTKKQPKIDTEIIDLDAEYPDENDNKPLNAATSTADTKETSKSEARKAKKVSKLPKVQVPSQTRHGALVAQNPDADIEFVPRNFRREMLHTVLELLSTDSTSKTLTFDKAITRRNKEYLVNVLQKLKYCDHVIVAWTEQRIADEIVERYKALPDVFVRGCVSDNQLEVEFSKVRLNELDRDMNEIILDQDISEITAYIEGIELKCETRKALDNLKFKILILLKILQFVKSNNEEIEIVFNKTLPKKQINYVGTVMENVNLRRKFGDNPPEANLSEDIKKNIKDAFLSHMFDQQCSAVTFKKHFRFKRLNRPDHVEKPKTFTSIDLDFYDSKPTDNTKVTDKEHKEIADDNVTGNDNDDFSDSNTEDEGSTRVIGKVLPPRDETVNMFEYLYMYDPSVYSNKNKASDTIVSKNIDNGDMVMDKNDSQTDMKNGGAQSKCMDDDEEVEYVFLVDNEEDKEEFMLIDDFNSSEIKFSEKFFGNDGSVNTLNVNENCGENTNHNTEEIIDQVQPNTDNACDQKPQGNISESQVKINVEIKSENQDTTMIEIDLKKPKEDNNTKEELIEEVKDVSSKEISEKSSKMDAEDIIKRIDDIVNTENETDCDISFDKDDLVLSEENCDNQSLDVSHSKMETENCVDITDEKNTEIKNVYIVNIQHPVVKITNEKARKIQEIISEQIMLSEELPLLKCHGVRNGALIYTCHNKSTFDFLENSVQYIGDLKVLNTIDVTKMSVKLFCLFAFDTVYLFNMIELYNKQISTKDWVVETREFYDGYTVFVIKMDKASIDFIHASNLALFAGVDKLEFSLIWE